MNNKKINIFIGLTIFVLSIIMYVIAIFTKPFVLFMAFALTVALLGYCIFLVCKKKTFCSAILLILSLFLLAPSSLAVFGFNKTEGQVIVHACGQIDGKNYLNCEEAFAKNVEDGQTLIEIDFLFTSDGKIIASHLLEYFPGFNLKNRPSFEQATTTLLLGKYHVLTFEKLMDYMLLYPDVKIVFDTKEDDSLSLIESMFGIAETYGVNLKERFIIQVYSFEDYQSLSQLEFNEYWFTNYKAFYSPSIIKKYFENEEKVTTIVLSQTIWYLFRMVGFSTSKDIGVHAVSDSDYISFLNDRGVKYLYLD